MDLHALEALLYYCCLINGGLLLISAGLLMGFQEWYTVTPLLL